MRRLYKQTYLHVRVIETNTESEKNDHNQIKYTYTIRTKTCYVKKVSLRKVTYPNKIT